MSTGEVSGGGSPSWAPPAEWYEQDHRGHVVQFYAEDGFLLEGLSRFIGTALGAGDAAVVVATKAHRDGLAERLRARGFNTASAIRRGRLVLLDAVETLAKILVNDRPDAGRFSEIIGGVLTRARAAGEGETPRVVVFGEMVALQWAQGRLEAALRLEQLWNDLAKVQTFSLRCAYPMSSFFRDEHGESLLKICGEHGGVIPGESYTMLENSHERMRSITHLQHKAQALETVKAERRQIQQSLRQRESELADFLENALEGVQQVGPDQRILWANRALLNLLGYSYEEYVNHTASHFHVDTHVFDEYWQRLMRREDIYDYPAELRCKDGSVRHVLIQSNGVWEGEQFVRTRCFVRDVTEQMRMEKALREGESRLRVAKEELETLAEQRTAALRRLSAQVLNLQDYERRRIARELHDSLGQYLTALKINTDMLRRTPGNSELWAQSGELMERCVSEVRTLSYLLHPPMMDAVGLASAARWYVEGFGQRSGIKVTLQVPHELARMPDEVELALFRAIQEALTNVHRHSGASSADVLILRDAEQVILEVRDNGRGIAKEQVAHFAQTGAAMGVGLTGMRERVRELGGSLHLESNGSGTVLRIAIPVEEESLAESDAGGVAIGRGGHG